MSDFWLFFTLGLEHVLDLNAYDHILFLVALCASYSFVSWRKLLLLVSLFTLGHTLSLVLSSYQIVTVSGRLIEFLIPLTILVAAIYNLFTAGRSQNTNKQLVLYLVTLFFGLIHGFGFASYYKMINTEGNLMPLFEFALGVEMAQIIIVLIALLLAYVCQTFFRFSQRDWVLVISSVVIGMAIPMLVDNWIF
ncbi:HupE/UreJ family protein [Ulvibacter antarcticus]|uniref:HupE/UreJ protein n=1 Tax=Ulvibacter antarcticus TaxID=442714 RepID=A0A3L9Z149_9FLAO|nr:HupE/UreJ family protein [Ulvibacter antarcticus]RMA66234.1 HupE/UreJ protein [Ulvibacter antarcticus]